MILLAMTSAAEKTDLCDRLALAAAQISLFAVLIIILLSLLCLNIFYAEYRSVSADGPLSLNLTQLGGM